MLNINELRLDSEEFGKLINEATRRRVKDALTAAKAEVDREIVTLELKQKQAAAAPTLPKRYLVELHEYAWDQSDKFVKLFINVEGVQNLPEENVTVKFTENSMKLLVSNLNNKDYGLTVNNLLEPIDVNKSYRKIKTGMVAIYLKKQSENKNWAHLTTLHNRLENNRYKSEDQDTNGEPADALVNIMKKMYQSGDAQAKQMIAKAWSESQEMARKGD